jgi:hypothetical protein
MTKLVLSSAALALVLAVPAEAMAQSAANGGSQSACPPGTWFCAEPPAPAPAAQPLEPLPDPDEAPVPPQRRAPSARPPGPPPPPPVAYEPPPPVMLARPEGPPPYEYRVPRRGAYPEPGREWGLNLHFEGAMIGHGSAGDAGLGGAGAGLRLKPSRYFGIESDLDFVGGHGYAGDVRHETGLSFNALLFLNPRSRGQLYLLAGFGWAWAHSQCDATVAACPGSQSADANYTYFGGQVGAGIEVRLTRSLALNADLRGFMRTRTDALASSTPEFGPDASGRTTNTSGGALLTGGMTLYF